MVTMTGEARCPERRHMITWWRGGFLGDSGGDRGGKVIEEIGSWGVV